MPAGGRFFMVMQLLGPNLSAARRNALGGQAELQAAKVGWLVGRAGGWAKAAGTGQPLLLQRAAALWKTSMCTYTLSSAAAHPLPCSASACACASACADHRCRHAQGAGAGAPRRLHPQRRQACQFRDGPGRRTLPHRRCAKSWLLGCLAAQGGVVGVRRRLPHCAFGPIVASCGFEQPSQ